MTRTLRAAVAAVAILVLWAAPASASAGQAKKLSGSINGTTTWGGGVPGCDYVDQTFAATYAGGSGAGPVTLHIHACVSGVVPTVGTFTATERHGSLAGTIAGTSEVGSAVIFELDLTPTSGAGVLARQVKSIHVHMEWTIGDPAGSPFTGRVAAA